MITPGGAEPIHFHPAEDETFYVLEGVLRFLMGETWHEAPAGSVVYVPRGVHGFHNASGAPARVLCLNVPGGLHEGLFAQRLAAGDCRPSCSLVGVTRLAIPTMLVEIEATAAR